MSASIVSAADEIDSMTSDGLWNPESTSGSNWRSGIVTQQPAQPRASSFGFRAMTAMGLNRYRCPCHRVIACRVGSGP